jgi:hypothetical protein
VATHDYVISNGTGSAVRSDINGALAAIVSNNSGATEPTTMYAYQWWADTTTGLLKIRNAANSAWVTVGTLASANLGLLPLAGGTMTGVLAVTAGTAALPGIAVSGDPNTGIYSPGADQLAITTGGTVRTTVDSSGRLLVGTSSARANFFNTTISPGFQLEGTSTTNSVNRFSSVVFGDGGSSGPIIALGKHRSSSVGGTTVVASGDEMGQISFQGSDGTEFVEGANIRAEVDGTPGANDMPGRLVFSTTTDGASSPSERCRIGSNGYFYVGTSDSSPAANNVAGFVVEAGNGSFQASRMGEKCADFNRGTNDGAIVNLRQDGVIEGTISVSGTTVSYNGAHLSRWSQLPGGSEREEILRGTVLSNIDEMCAWGEEDNEQLNRMKVSDVEGDKNVSGVFQAWDDDDDTYTDDFYCAMTGDFIIRIAEGVTVERGDLLMSAGDGTAKPQDDDIIRSKTVAKVTSTHVTCTYEDGSYCVPCVLMAC